MNLGVQNRGMLHDGSFPAPGALNRLDKLTLQDHCSRGVNRGLLRWRVGNDLGCGENQTDTRSIGFVGIGECMGFFENRAC